MKNTLLAGPEWTQDEAINYECARECITDLMGIYSGAIANEEATVLPDPSKIRKMLAFRLSLAQERMGLRLESHDRLANVQSKYSAQIRAHRGPGRGPASSNLTIGLDPNTYRLTKARHDAIFERIKSDSFSLARAAERSVAVIFGGQPGSGKSAALSRAMDELGSSGSAAEIVEGNFRGYHPAFDKLMTQDDQTAAFYTAEDTGRWVDEAIAYAKQRRLNVVIGGTMLDGDKVAETLINLRAGGYGIDARVLAVNPKFSWQGVMQRYEKQKFESGNGCMTTLCVHQAAYDGISSTLGRIEHDKLADRVTLYRRGMEVVYANALHDGHWADPPQATQALEHERNRTMSFREAWAYEQAFEAISAMMERPERQASDREINSLRQLQTEAALATIS